jgi:hypothetical protein
VTAACIHCNDTGSLSKDLAGHLDCAHCTVANERAELEKWAKENRVSYVTETDLWLIFQHARSKAPAKIDSYNNATARDVQRGSRGYSSGDEILAEDIGYVLGWNACVDAAGTP